MILEKRVRQGQHGEAFVHAMASTAGLQVAWLKPDVDGIDLQIAYPDDIGAVRSPCIAVQVKSWSSPIDGGDHWQGRIPVRNFNALAGAGFVVPRFLVVVTVPRNADEYVHCDQDRMAMRHAAYYLSLADRDVLPRIGGPTRTVRVRIPKRNMLTVATLTGLVVGDAEGALR